MIWPWPDHWACRRRSAPLHSRQREPERRRSARTEKRRRSRHEEAHCDCGCMGVSPGSRCSLGRCRGPLSNMPGVLLAPFPSADVADEVVAGQIKVQRGNRDVAFAKAGNVGLRSAEAVRGIVG